jgi:hypothetical protein
MSIDKKFLFAILVSIVLFVVAGFAVFKLKVINLEFYRAVLLSNILCLIYSVLGVLFIRLAFTIPGKSFINVVLGGIIARLFLILLLVIICLKVLYVKEDIFIFSLFIFYNYFLILEIYYLIKKDSLKLK